MNAVVWYLLAGVFLLSAALQLNDPDPLYWSVAYAGAAFSCARFAHGGAPRTLIYLALGVALAGTLTSASGFFAWMGSGASLSADMSVPHVEAAREFIGIGAATAALLVGLVLTAQGRSS